VKGEDCSWGCIQTWVNNAGVLRLNLDSRYSALWVRSFEWLQVRGYRNLSDFLNSSFVHFNYLHFSIFTLVPCVKNYSFADWNYLLWSSVDILLSRCQVD
jgi:hypothetical protein